MPEDQPIVLGCNSCGSSEGLPLDDQLAEQARRFLIVHGECVTTVDLGSISLFRALSGRR